MVEGLSWNVFEFIASKPMPSVVGVGAAARAGSSGVVPRHVEADRAVGAGERVERGDVVELLLVVARLAAAGEAAEAGAAGAHRPRRSRDGERPDLFDHPLRVVSPAGEPVAGVAEIGLVIGHQLGLAVDDRVGLHVQWHGCPLSIPDDGERAAVAVGSCPARRLRPVVW